MHDTRTHALTHARTDLLYIWQQRTTQQASHFPAQIRKCDAQQNRLPNFVRPGNRLNTHCELRRRPHGWNPVTAFSFKINVTGKKCPIRLLLFISVIYIYFFLWRCDPTRVKASSFLRFLDHTQRRTTVGRTPLNE
jgi:hypothetical protein